MDSILKFNTQIQLPQECEDEIENCVTVTSEEFGQQFKGCFPYNREYFESQGINVHPDYTCSNKYKFYFCETDYCNQGDETGQYLSDDPGSIYDQFVTIIVIVVVVVCCLIQGFIFCCYGIIACFNNKSQDKSSSSVKKKKSKTDKKGINKKQKKNRSNSSNDSNKNKNAAAMNV